MPSEGAELYFIPIRSGYMRTILTWSLLSPCTIGVLPNSLWRAQLLNTFLLMRRCVFFDTNKRRYFYIHRHFCTPMTVLYSGFFPGFFAFETVYHNEEFQGPPDAAT